MAPTKAPTEKRPEQLTAKHKQEELPQAHCTTLCCAAPEDVHARQGSCQGVGRQVSHQGCHQGAHREEPRAADCQAEAGRAAMALHLQTTC